MNSAGETNPGVRVTSVNVRISASKPVVLPLLITSHFGLVVKHEFLPLDRGVIVVKSRIFARPLLFISAVKNW